MDFILGLIVGGLVGAAIMAVMTMSSRESKLEESNPPFNLETPSRLSQRESDMFWWNE